MFLVLFLRPRRNPLFGRKRVQRHLLIRKGKLLPPPREAKAKGHAGGLDHLGRVDGSDDGLGSGRLRGAGLGFAFVGLRAKGVVEKNGDEGHFEAEDGGGDADGEVAVGEFRGGLEIAAGIEEGE